MYSALPECSLCLISVAAAAAVAAAASRLILPGAGAVQQMVKRCGLGTLGLN